jgi:exodeoxyribonuclease V alpha subunit
MTAADMLHLLARWRDAGWLRSLDVALARFIHEADPRAPASLLLAGALVAQVEGRGHTGLPLDELAHDAAAALDWPPEAITAFHAAGWPADAAARRDAWQGCAALQIDPADDTGSSPLVLAGGLLYLRRYWQHESRVAAQVRARAAEPDPAAAAIDEAAARSLLDRLFGPATPGAPPDWQKVAGALALRGRLLLLTGGPGTGKTHTAARLLVLLQALHAGAQPLRVALAAPTGKAAARLRQSIGKALHGLAGQLDPALPLQAWAQQVGPARTLHALLGTQPGTRRFRHDAANPLEVDVLFVDEASMGHLEMMAQLLDALPATARVLLLGDKDQLASVEAGAVMGDLCHGAEALGDERGGYWPDTAAWVQRLTGCAVPVAPPGAGSALAQQTVMLRRSHRFDGPIGRLASAINRGDAGAALDELRARADGPVALAAGREASAAVSLALHGRAGAAGSYRTYLDRLRQRPQGADATQPAVFDAWAKAVLRSFDDFRVLCAVRDGPAGVSGLNAAIERALCDAGLLQRRGEWYEGRPVMVTRNDPSLGMFNGDIGIVLRSPAGDGALRCYFLDGDELRSASVSRLADVETAFAMTVHKSQGSEFGHVVLVLPDEDVAVLTRELVYTGVTRAAGAFTLVAKNPGLLATATGRLTRRVSGLRGML